MTSYHKTNLGKFGGSIICDTSGYAHNTVEEWLVVAEAIMSDKDYVDKEYRQEWAEERVVATIAAIEAANQDVADWQSENC